VEVTKLYERYRQIRGSLPHPDSECTEVQLSAVKHVNDMGLAPAADFAVFGLHGNRLLRRLHFTATFMDAEGHTFKKELPGPPDYQTWWCCFKPYRTGLIMHNIADTEHLDNYSEHIKALDNMYKGRFWFLIAMADYRMRSEHFERIRRRAELHHAQLTAAHTGVANALSDYDPARPWNDVFREAVADVAFWEAEVKDKAQMLINAPQSIGTALADGTQYPGDHNGGKDKQWLHPNPPGPKIKKRERKAALSKAQTNARDSACAAFNSAAGCQRQGCTEPHVCSICGYKNHGSHVCFSRDGANNKGKGKGKGGKKGGRRR